MVAFQTLEKKFGKPHPKLAEYRVPPIPFRWLSDAFFRLHRRRQIGQHGFQPLSYQEMAGYADHVLNLEQSERSLYFRVMEETDNAVLYDRWQKDSAELEEIKKEPKKPRKKPGKTPPKPSKR